MVAVSGHELLRWSDLAFEFQKFLLGRKIVTVGKPVDFLPSRVNVLQVRSPIRLQFAQPLAEGRFNICPMASFVPFTNQAEKGLQLSTSVNKYRNQPLL
jgi:hypothetical protein